MEDKVFLSTPHLSFQVFNASIEQIIKAFSRFGDVVQIDEEKKMSYKTFIEFIQDSNLKFEQYSEDFRFKYVNTKVGNLYMLPSTDISKDLIVFIQNRHNLNTGNIDLYGRLFLLNSAYNVSLNLNLTYQSLNPNKIYFELSYALSREVDCYLPVSEFPSGKFITRFQFEKLFGISLRTIEYDFNGRAYYATNQEPVYIASRFYRHSGIDTICRPRNGELFIIKLDHEIER
jgi:hypothetical protein